MPDTKNSSRALINFVSPSGGPPRNAMGSRITMVLPCVLVLVLASGCSKDEMNRALETAKSKTRSMTNSAVGALEEGLPESGEVTLTLEPDPIVISQAELNLISTGDGRPNVIQITTYASDAFARSYPALLLHGITNISTASNLVGEKVQCDVYYQESEISPIAMTKPGEAMTVAFQQYNPTDKTLTATLGIISLRGSDDGATQIKGGDLMAVIREETK